MSREYGETARDDKSGGGAARGKETEVRRQEAEGCRAGVLRASRSVWVGIGTQASLVSRHETAVCVLWFEHGT